MNITQGYQLYMDAFRSCAGKFKERIAVHDEKSSITYAELNRSSDIIAFQLLSRGVKKGNPIVMYVPRVKEAIVAALAIWKAGGVFVPVDDSYPKERIDYMISDSDALCVCSVHSIWDTKPLNMPIEKLIFLDEVEDYDRDFRGIAFPECSPDDDALVIYTSGSTGKPKGALHTHLSLFSLANWQPDSEKPLSENSRFVNLTSFSFIACITELFSPLLSGGSTFIVTDQTKKDLKKLYNLLCQNGITNVYAPVRLAALLLANYDMRPFEVRTGGERVTRFHSLYKTTVTQLYGSSEGCFTVTGTINGSEEPMPLGVPNKCIDYMILDDELVPVAPGAIGEFTYSGPILAKEYLNRPDQTAEKWFTKDGKRWYRTGDLVYEGSDGLLYYVERKDFMVKINGFRVELGEIENNVLDCSGVEEVVCVSREVNGGMHLCCFFSGKGVTQEDAQTIRETISTKLPDYMMPSFLIYLEYLPRNANGKIDRQSLPEIDVSALLSNVHTEPENDLQRQIRASFAIVLGIDEEKIGIDDSFFDLGGNSILVMPLLMHINTDDLSSTDIFKARTVRAIAEVVKSRASSQIRDPDAVERAAKLVPHYLTRFQSRIFADQMVVPGSTVWNVHLYFRLSDNVDVDRLCKAVNTVLEHHSAFSTILQKDADGKPVLVHVPEARLTVGVEYLSEQELRELEKDIILPFETFGHPLYQIRIFKTEEHVYLFTDIHHLLMDGTAFGIMNREIVQAYNGMALTSKDYFYTFLSEQEHILTTDEYRKAKDSFTKFYGDLKHWRGVPDWDFNSEERLGATTGFLPCGLTVEDLVQAEQHHNTSRNVLAVAAALLAIYAHSGEPDVMVSWAYDNRGNSLFDNTIGSLVMDFPVALHITESIKVSDCIESIKKQVVDCIAGSACEYITEQYVPFKTDTFWVNYLGGLLNNDALSTLGAAPVKIEKKHSIAKSNMGFMVFELPNGQVLINLHYCSSLYKKETVLRYYKLFQNTFVKLVRSSGEVTIREII